MVRLVSPAIPVKNGRKISQIPHAYASMLILDLTTPLVFPAKRAVFPASSIALFYNAPNATPHDFSYYSIIAASAPTGTSSIPHRACSMLRPWSAATDSSSRGNNATMGILII
jgi:hypothetical protein